MVTRIDTVASRDKLKPRREPYWHRLLRGSYLGFRKMTSESAGVWVARARDEEAGPTRQVYESLGDFGALPDHLRYDAAVKAAQSWFEHLGRGGTTGASTVQEACSRYVKHLRTHKNDRAADDAEARLRNNVLNSPKLASTELTKLTPVQLDAWRKALKQKPTRSGGRRGEARRKAL